MEISLLLMQQIAQLFLILIMGYAVVKVGLLKASDSRVLSVVMVYLVTPCVIINAFQIDDTPEIRKGLLYSMAIAAAIHVVLLVLSALLSRPLKLDAVEQVNVIYSNAAALVIPLVKALMGDAYVIYSCAFIIVQLVLGTGCRISETVGLCWGDIGFESGFIIIQPEDHSGHHGTPGHQHHDGDLRGSHQGSQSPFLCKSER